VWEEHFASATVRTIIEALHPQVAAATTSAPDAPAALLACPPEEQHDLGLRMLSDRFELAGWRAYYLGADTPVAEIVTAARELDVAAVVLSASTHYHRLRLRKVVAEIVRQLPEVRLLVGGTAFAQDPEGWEGAELLDPDAFFAEPWSGV
jgi:methanogenic corrinoid protein MtbC1